MQTSARIWVRKMLGISPTIEDARAAGYANLNIATDEQIWTRLGVTRQVARSQFVQGMKRREAGDQPSKKQRAAVNYLAGSFVWPYAFDDERLIADLGDVLLETGAMAATDRPGLVACGPFVALHALTLMHRSCLKLPDQ